MECKIGSQAFVGGWIDPATLVADDKRAGGGLALFIFDAQGQRVGWPAIKQHRSFIAEPEVLSALTDV
jgi:hypothetical protein